jgi:hypothetical protein
MILSHKSNKQVFRSSSGTTENNREAKSLEQVSRERERGEEGEGGGEGVTGREREDGRDGRRERG